MCWRTPPPSCGELGHRLRLRRVPELRFFADPGIRYSIRLQQVLRELGIGAETAPGEGGPDGEGRVPESAPEDE